VFFPDCLLAAGIQYVSTHKLPLHQSAEGEFVFFVMQIISDNPSVLCSLGAYPTARLQRAFGMESNFKSLQKQLV